MSAPLRLLHLYPEELGINGDAGNALCLQRRAEWRGHDLEVLRHGIGDPWPEQVDLVLIGSGPRSAQRAVHDELLHGAARLREWQADGVPLLAIAAGWQLLGRELVLEDGTRLQGAGVLPSTARLAAGRANGEFTGRTPDGLLVAGYENHGAVFALEPGAEPLLAVGHGLGSTGLDPAAVQRFEGVRAGASIGTSLHGPFLPMNPAFADALLAAALLRKGLELGPADARTAEADELARRSREAVLGRVGA